MKNLKIIIALFIGVFAMTTASAQKDADNATDSYEIQVDGLGCPFCAYGLEKKFKEFKGIKKVKIDIETGDFSFTYPASKALSLETVTAQVEKAGYTPKTAKITRASGKVETLNSTKKTKVTGETASTSFFVNGVCGMCKARIEKAASSVNGVAAATWNEDSKMLKVSFDKKMTSQKAVEDAVVKVGHDTKTSKTSNETYKSLPGCCHYNREK